jgi:hypothetical protein
MVEYIFRGRELTISQDGKCILRKYNQRNLVPIEVPPSVVKLLIQNEILVLDSGNTETGEKHYTFDPDSKNLEYINSMIAIWPLEIKSDLNRISRILKLEKIGI